MSTRTSETIRCTQGYFSGQAPLFAHFEAARLPAAGSHRHIWQPLTDVYETPDAVVVRMDLAGVRPQDVQVELENGRVLTVSGVRHGPQECKRPGCYYQMEIHYGPFQRRIDLARTVDAENAVARHESGFLEIKLPMVQAQERPTRFVVVIST